jgi:peptidoglycan/LPS O-acetylase OafA/YrhL
VYGLTGSGPLQPTLPASLANVLLLHAWFPWPSYFFSLNNVSWTLSVEVFFYATFPILMIRIGRRWPFWLVLSLAAGYAMAGIGSHYPIEALEPDAATADSFVNINPLARWFEFVVGICGAVAWRRIEPRLRLGSISSTALEAFALVVVVLVAYYSNSMAGSLARNPAQFLWLARGPVAAPAFALLIAVMAIGRGNFSRLLAHAFPVRLGEISYALYLIHYPILKLAWIKFPDAASGPGLVLLLVLLVSSSQLLWQCVETPARRAMTGRFPMAPSSTSARLPPASERATLAAAATASLASLALLSIGQWLFAAG